MRKKKARQASKKRWEKIQQEKHRKERKKLMVNNWRMRLKLKDPGEGTSKGISSYLATYRASLQAKKTLPKTPRKRAAVLEKLCQSSPRTATILECKGILKPSSCKSLDMGEVIMKNIKEKLQESKPKGGCNKDKLQAYKEIKSSICVAPLSKRSKLRGHLKKYFDIRMGFPQNKNTDWWKRNTRKKRKDRLSDETMKKVKDFYLQPDVTRQIPGKTEVIKTKTETGEAVILPKHVMVMTLEDAFKMFKEENPDTKIGCSSFKKLKPKNVRKVSETSRRTCLCTKCCDVALKVQALKKFIATSSPENKDLADKMTKAYLCDAVVCAYSSHPDKKCLERECNQCPKLESCFEALRDHYQANSKAQGKKAKNPPFPYLYS